MQIGAIWKIHNPFILIYDLRDFLSMVRNVNVGFQLILGLPLWLKLFPIHPVHSIWCLNCSCEWCLQIIACSLGDVGVTIKDVGYGYFPPTSRDLGKHIKGLQKFMSNPPLHKGMAKTNPAGWSFTEILSAGKHRALHMTCIQRLELHGNIILQYW